MKGGKNMKNTFMVWHYNDKLEVEVLRYFDKYDEAKAYVLKCGDKNILAHIDVKIQEENPVYA